MNEYRVSRRFSVVLLALAFAVVAAPAFAIKVILEVDAAANELAIVSNDKPCPGAQMNCVKPDKGNSPFINFHLPDACGSKDEDPQFKLNRMQLSMIGSTGTIGHPSKGFGFYALPNIVVTDFKANAASGWVDLTTSPNSKSDAHLKVKDENSAEYVVYFQIEAIPCGAEGESIWLDPRIENTGK